MIEKEGKKEEESSEEETPLKKVEQVQTSKKRLFWNAIKAVWMIVVFLITVVIICSLPIFLVHGDDDNSKGVRLSFTIVTLVVGFFILLFFIWLIRSTYNILKELEEKYPGIKYKSTGIGVSTPYY